MRNHTESEGVCPDCGEKAREMNKEWLKKNPYPPVKLPQWEVDMINRNKSGMKLAEFKKALEWNDFAIGDTFWLDDIKFEVKDKRRIGFK